jgi:serine/threonine protein kinase
VDRIEALHSVGVVHRDIKPSNFVLNEQENKLYLIDFGLSHFYKYASLSPCIFWSFFSVGSI